MILQAGERLQGSGPPGQPGGYVVSALVRETPWYHLYAGKKILYNFDFTAKRIRETDDKEWLNVFLRTLRYPDLDDAADVGHRRGLARAEVRTLGNRASNLWPEPIDLLEIENTRDAFTFPPKEDDKEPIVVFARPHGQPLGDWQQSVVTVASLLSILAELLEFIRQTHGEGLLLQGLGPAGIVIDRSDRVHYIGSDMVVAQDEASSSALRSLFPPERFARGFAAPELFEAERSPSPRSDLYAWGTLAYFLLTGQTPWQLALEQGRPWAQFQETHFAKLEQGLRNIPPAHVNMWAEELGLPAQALVADWPGNVKAMFRWLLHAEPTRRPRSADEVRNWMIALPPPQVRAALALDAGNGVARVYLDITGLEAGAEVEVRRAVGQAPTQPGLGQLVYEARRAPCSSMSTPPSPRSRISTPCSRAASSPAVPYTRGASRPRPSNPTAATSCPWPKRKPPVAEGDWLPQRIGLCFAALDGVGLAEIFLASPWPRVCAWGVERLDQLLAKPSGAEAGPAAERLVWTALADSAEEVRGRAARVLWRRHAVKSDELLVRMASVMGRGELDDAVAAAKSFSAPGAGRRTSRARRQPARRGAAGSVPGVQRPAQRRERSEHLRNVHDYIDVGGSMLPRRQALDRLWQRVLPAPMPTPIANCSSCTGAAPRATAPRATAPRATTSPMRKLSKSRSCAAPSWTAPAGPADWPRRRGSAGSRGWHASAKLSVSPASCGICCWRRPSACAKSAGPWFCPSSAPGFRGGPWTCPSCAASSRRRFRGRSCSRPASSYAAQLAEVGVDQAKATACQALFHEELPVTCPECPARVRSKDLEVHLRRAHGIFQFRGMRRSYAETRDLLLETLTGPSPWTWSPGRRSKAWPKIATATMPTTGS